MFKDLPKDMRLLAVCLLIIFGGCVLWYVIVPIVVVFIALFG